MITLSGTSIYLKANGLLHHIRQYGAPKDPALVLLPGITSPAPTADFLADWLAKLGLCVYLPDIRGRGQTQVAPSGGYRMVDYAADVDGLIKALGLQTPFMVGHSMGARIAAAYTAWHVEEEHNLLVLVDPPLCGPGRGDYPTPIESFMEQLNEAKAGTTAEAVRRFYPKWPDRELQLRAHVLSSCDETAVRETHAAFSTEDFFEIWRGLTPATALIYGEESPVVTAQGVNDLARSNPLIPLYGVPSAGHMVPWDNREDFFKVLNALITAQL